MLNIDGHAGFQKLSRSGPALRPNGPSRRDREAFAVCDRGHPHAGLAQHPGKRARSATRKVVAALP
eukprot:8705330-Pyramimonas_sp.AAC.1